MRNKLNKRNLLIDNDITKAINETVVKKKPLKKMDRFEFLNEALQEIDS